MEKSLIVAIHPKNKNNDTISGNGSGYFTRISGELSLSPNSDGDDPFIYVYIP